MNNRKNTILAWQTTWQIRPLLVGEKRKKKRKKEEGNYIL
jgi:hypothetical protein